MAKQSQRPDWLWAILACAVTVHVLFVVSLETKTINRAFNDTYNRPGPAADFFAVYHAGRQVVTGLDPYVGAEDPKVTPPYAPFRYTPGVAFTLGVATTTVKPWVAYVAWLIALELLLCLCLLLVRRLIEDPVLRDLVSAAWLAFTPLFVELWMGQFTFATACLVFIAVVAWQEGRDKLAAGLWAVAAAIKLFPLALVPLLLRQKRFVAIGVGVGTLALSMVWFVWHPRDWEIFWRLNFSETDVQSFHSGNFGLQAFVYHLIALVKPLSPGQWKPVATVMSVSLCAVAAVAMLRRRDADPRVSAAIALMLLPLISKHVWEHHYVVALPALTLLVAAWAPRDASEAYSPRLKLLAAVYVLLWLPSLLLVFQGAGPTWYPQRDWTPTMRATYHALKPLALLGLFIYCARSQLREPA